MKIRLYVRFAPTRHARPAETLKRPDSFRNAMKRIFQKPWSYAVVFDEASDTHYLDVLCGEAGMYEVRVTLTPTEVANANGHWELLDALALSVCRDPGVFSGRIVYL